MLYEHLVLPQGGLSDWLQFLRELRSKQFDYAFDFMGNPRSAMCTRVSGAKHRVGMVGRRSWAYNLTVPRQSGEDYIVKEKFRILAAAGVRATNERLMLPWTPQHMKPADDFLTSEPTFANAELRIALSPTHRRVDRRWPEVSWAALADKLTTEHRASVLWVWGPGEREEVTAIQGLCRSPTWLAPKTSFRELAALVAQCELFIGNSNGPSHVAVAVNTPSLQLHGPTDAPSWCPMTARHQAVAKSSMQDITVDEVLSRVSSLRELARQSTAGRGEIKSELDALRVRPNLGS